MMNRSLAFVVGISFIMMLAAGCRRTEVSYWENGARKSEVAYRGKALQGTSVWYFLNGSKQMEATYVRGQLEGQTTRWYYNGIMESVTHYVKGTKNGPSVTWDENGSKIAEETYQDDMLHGPYFVWHPNGNLRISGFFDHGLFDSTWFYYDEYGMKVGEGVFRKGSGVQKGLSPSGKRMREINYVDNQKHGEERWFDEQGQVEKILIYEHDRLIREISGE